MKIVLRRALTGVAGSSWNQWPVGQALGGRMAVEYALCLSRFRGQPKWKDIHPRVTGAECTSTFTSMVFQPSSRGSSSPRALHFFGLHGLFGALTFYAVWRRLNRPNNSLYTRTR